MGYEEAWGKTPWEMKRQGGESVEDEEVRGKKSGG